MTLPLSLVAGQSGHIGWHEEIHADLTLKDGGSPIARKPVIGDGQVFVSVLSGDDANDGLSWGSAFATLDAAYAAVPNGGTIDLSLGNHGWSATIAPSPSTKTRGRGKDLRTGGHGTTITYTGTGFAYDLTGVNDCVWEDMKAKVNNVAAGGFCDMGLTCYNNAFLRMQVDGPGPGIGTGFRLHGQGTCQCFNHWVDVDCTDFLALWVFSGDSNGNHLEGCTGGLTNGWTLDFTAILTDTKGGSDNVIERHEMDGATVNGIRESSGAARNYFEKVQQDGVTGIGLQANGGGKSQYVCCEFQGTVTDGVGSNPNVYIGCTGLPTSVVPAGYSSRFDKAYFVNAISVFKKASSSFAWVLGSSGAVAADADGASPNAGLIIGTEGFAAGAISFNPNFVNSRTRIKVANGASYDEVMAFGSGPAVAWFGSNPTTKKTVTGSRAGNAALASLLTGLAGYGLITDSSTA